MKVIIVAAMTADGYIGKTSEHLATAWTNEDDKYMFTHFIKEAGNMVMGLNTFLTTAKKFPSVFTKSMPGRRLMVYTHQPDEVTKYPEVEAVDEDPKTLIARLEHQGVKTLAICGGSQIYTMFMKAGVVDELYIDMQATLFGKGVPLFNDSLEAKIALCDIERLGDNNVLLHYCVHRDA